MSSGGASGGGPSAGMEEVRIVADTENNSLLIWATSQNYERILNTLEKMDVTPRQVLIEATIAEVTLTGKLQYGLQWFFNNDIGKNYTGNGSLGLPTDLTLTDALKSIPAGQFTYAITDSAGMVKALLRVGLILLLRLLVDLFFFNARTILKLKNFSGQIREWE